jgi:hypothetical protein
MGLVRANRSSPLTIFVYDFALFKTERIDENPENDPFGADLKKSVRTILMVERRIE